MNQRAIQKALNDAGYGSLPWVDATEPLELLVSAADCRLGRPKDHSNCAAAVAFKKRRGVKDVFVTATRTYVVYSNRVVRYVNPEETQEAIRHFDDGQVVPFGRAVVRFIPPVGYRILGHAATRARKTSRGARSRPRQSYQRIATR